MAYALFDRDKRVGEPMLTELEVWKQALEAGLISDIPAADEEGGVAPVIRGRDMALLTVQPTKPDIIIARAVARNTSRGTEKVARALTWGADEKLMLLLAAAGWIATRGRSEHLRRAGNHALLVTAMASLLPHALKLAFDQTRPDRRTVLGHVHGISFSGKRDDAFPSGHALHMGALASASGELAPGPRAASLIVAIGLSLTRVLVLAHWASDVLAGFMIGVALERLLRFWTGYGRDAASVPH